MFFSSNWSVSSTRPSGKKIQGLSAVVAISVLCNQACDGNRHFLSDCWFSSSAFGKAQCLTRGVSLLAQHNVRGSLWNYCRPPWAFWTLGDTKNSAHSKVKREDWTGRKRGKVGQLCPSTETGLRAGLWSTVGANCTHLINQSMTASSRKAIVRPKNVTSTRYPSLNYPRSRIELASVLAIRTSLLRDTLYREEEGRVWKWVILICVGSKPFLTCLRQFLSIH